MPSPQLDQFRQQNAQYQNWPDAQLAVALHKKFYSHVPMIDYLGSLGLDRGDALYELRQNGNQYGDYLRSALATPGGGESKQDAQRRQSGFIPDRRAGTGEGAGRAFLQGQTLGWGDELVAGGAAMLDPLVHGDRGKDFGQRYDAYLNRERGLVENFREDNPVVAYGSEIAGTIPTALVTPFPAGRAGQLAIGGLEGAVYGAGSSEGDIGQRGVGAMIGAPFGVAGTFGGQMLGKAIGGIAGRNTARIAKAQAIAAAPSAADLKATSKGFYDAVKKSDVVINAGALNAMKTRVRDVFTDEGLIFPSGRLADGYPKLRNAWRALQEYSRGPIDLAQAQRISKAIRKAIKSTDADESRIAQQLLDEFDTFMTSLPQSAFARGNGKQAVTDWASARGGWARFKRTETIEDAIAKARTSNKGFAEGMRREFASIVNSAKKRRGFDKATLDAMRKVAEGAPIDDFLRFLQRGGALPAYMMGHVAGGPVSGTIAGIGKMAGNLGLRAISNRTAQGSADAIRAGVAGGASMPPIPSMPPPRLSPALGAGVVGAVSPEQRNALVEILVQGGR